MLVIFLFGLFFIQCIPHSPFGHEPMAARVNGPRSISLGYKMQRNKLLAFMLTFRRHIDDWRLTS